MLFAHAVVPTSWFQLRRLIQRFYELSITQSFIYLTPIKYMLSLHYVPNAVPDIGHAELNSHYSQPQGTHSLMEKINIEADHFK